MSTHVVCIGGSRVTRLIFAACLRREGFSCLCFENVTDALTALKTQQHVPLAIFVAAILPRPLTDGSKVVRLLRKYRRFRASTFVLFSHRIDVFTQGRALLAGATHMLPLPLRTQQIVALVAQCAVSAEERSSHEQ